MKRSVWSRRITIWALPVVFLSFLLSVGTATWFGPNSHSFVAMTANGFILVALLVVFSALPAPQATRDKEGEVG